MTTAASGENNARPPVKHAASSPGVAVRRTAQVRPLLPVTTKPVSTGFAPDDPYVRRYWVAAIGAGAVTELLRLMRTGIDGGSVPLPRWLSVLMRYELVSTENGSLIVADRVPPVPATLLRRFSPGLRDQHRRALAASRPRPFPPQGSHS